MHWRLILLVLIGLAGCDVVQPESEVLPVVEAFVVSGQSMPDIILRKTAPIRDRYELDESTALNATQLNLRMQDMMIPYSLTSPGRYVPDESVIAIPGAEIDLELFWEDQIITAQQIIPPPIALDSFAISISDQPVQSLVLESVFIDPSLVDSLGLEALGAGAREELVYIVEATLYWTVDGSGDPNIWWMRTQLRPNLGQDRRLGNYFLSPEVMQLEADLPTAGNHRFWSGAYAVPVDLVDDPVPVHRLRMSIVRCSQPYVDFVSASSYPLEREPPSNIAGARGIFAGLAMDTLTITLAP
ncbi:MAG: hypothetical protein OXF84_02000 [Bacteroidetes bacterium]|nr:hypothetical protein [Bacteroidota bacterium]